jgi:hypothetical protein
MHISPETSVTGTITDLAQADRSYAVPLTTRDC